MSSLVINGHYGTGGNSFQFGTEYFSETVDEEAYIHALKPASERAGELMIKAGEIAQVVSNPGAAIGTVVVEKTGKNILGFIKRHFQNNDSRKNYQAL